MRATRHWLLLVGLLMGASHLDAAEPKTIYLWEAGAPGARGTEERDRPMVRYFAPDKPDAKRAAVVICPGGGYGHLAFDYEGEEVARWLNQRGVAGFVLRYRLAPHYQHPSPMLDAQRAIRLVRARAQEFGVSPERIGIWGFSAGGHLASTVATHFDAGDPKATDPIDQVSCRPDFAVLAYPVITFGESTHSGSRKNLLGETPDPKLVESLSNEKQVTAKTPPVFLFHTSEDKPVPAENSVLFYLALRKHGIPAELHIYERGRHGVGLASKNPLLATWPGLAANWLRAHGFIENASP